MRTRAEEIFHAVLDLSAEDRARYFTERSVDVTTQREVEALLRYDSHFSRSLDDDIGHVARQVWVQG